MRFLKSLCMMMALLCALPIAALAQTMGGSITGLISDPNGAAVAGAKVTATNTATGNQVSVDSTQAGIYAIPLLPAGPYTVTVKQTGFKTFVREGIEVRVGLAEGIDIKLELGTVQQQVEVKGQAPVLETANETKGTSITSEQMDTLPFFSGQAIRLANAFVSYTPGYNGNGEVSVNGGTGRSQEVMIDGGSTISPESGGTSFYFAGFEPYGEMRLITSGFEAENGYVGGGIEEFVTKSGTNDIHGSMFFNFERQIFNAVPFTTNATQNTSVINSPCIAIQPKACRPLVRYNDEGGAAGGPISIPHIYNGKNRTFFYFTYEGYWQPASVTTNSGESVPTTAMKQGNFAGLAPIYDPATTTDGTRTQFSGNVIPTTRFSNISNKILPYFPTPAVTQTSPEDDYYYNSTSALTDWNWSIKVDHTIHSNHHIAAFFDHRLNSTNAVQYYPGPLSNGQDSTYQPHQFRLSYDWVVNPHMIMHSYFSTSNDNTLQHSPLQAGYGCKLGFTAIQCGSNQDVTPVLVFQTDLTTSFASGNATTIDPCSTCSTFGQYQAAANNKGQTNRIFMGGQTLTLVHNKHEFKMGWEERRFATFNVDWSQSQGVYLFNQEQTESSSGVATTGESFASFLLGDVNVAGASGIPIATFPGANIRYSYSAGFFQDTWRLRPRFTLNLGLRYEVPINWHYVNGTDSSFSETAVNPQAGNLPGAMIFMGNGVGHTGSQRPFPTDFSDVGPRAGFAWTVRNNWVIRSSYGIFYEREGNGGCGCTDGFGTGSWTNTSDGFDPVFQWDATANTVAGGPPSSFKPSVQYPGVDNFGAGGPIMMGPRFGIAPRIFDGNFTVQHQYKNWLFEAAYVSTRTHGAAASDFINTVPTADLNLANTGAPITMNGVTVAANTNLLAYSFNNASQAATLNALGYYAPSGNGSLNANCAGWSECWTTGWGSGATLAQSLRPFPQMGTVYSGNSGDGWLAYDALQVKVEHRFGDLNFQGFWVWSKTLDRMAYRQIFEQCCVEQTQDANNVADSKTFDNSDIPDTVGFIASYNLPFGRGKKFFNSSSRLVDGFIGGWNVAGVGHYASGLLAELTSPSNALGAYLFEPLTKATATGAALKTNIGAGQLKFENPSSRWFTATSTGSSASYIQTPAGVLGNVSIYQNQFRQPWGRYENMSVNKIVHIWGEGKVYMRFNVDAFNPFNRAALGGISTSIAPTTTNFGEATGYNVGLTNRSLSMGLRLFF